MNKLEYPRRNGAHKIRITSKFMLYILYVFIVIEGYTKRDVNLMEN